MPYINLLLGYKSVGKFKKRELENEARTSTKKDSVLGSWELKTGETILYFHTLSKVTKVSISQPNSSIVNMLFFEIVIADNIFCTNSVNGERRAANKEVKGRRRKYAWDLFSSSIVLREKQRGNANRRRVIRKTKLHSAKSTRKCGSRFKQCLFVALVFLS